MADPVPEVRHDASPRPASDEVVLRTATAADLPAIAAVYNDAVLHSVATFDVEPQPPDLFADRVASTRPGDHVVVAAGRWPGRRHGVRRDLPPAPGLRRHP